jgi:AcrR family transcriptional regulator
VLDAAIAVLAEGGPRGLTYQAVDAQAGVPAGTASNHFRNRDALVSGVVAHLVELDRREFDALAALRPDRPNSAGLAEALVGFARLAIGPGRARTTARYALALAATDKPEWRALLAGGRAEITAWGVDWLAECGSAAPELHAVLLTDFLDGVILHEIAYPAPGFDPADRIRAFVRALLG